jgi:hypothetical protein
VNLHMKSIRIRWGPLLGPSSPTQLPHSPNVAFRYIDAEYLSIIIKASLLQKKKDLAYLAEDYILDSYRNIQIVVSLNVKYRGSKRAVVSVWESDMSLKKDKTLYLHAKNIVDDEV